MPTGRFTAKHSHGLRWEIRDEKYNRSFIVDLSPAALANHKHGECDCREFYFHVHIKATRTTCQHIDFLVSYLQSIGQPLEQVPPPRFSP